MSLIIRLVGAAAILVASANALSIVPHDNSLIARSSHHHHREVAPESTDLEKRQSPRIGLAWSGDASNIKCWKNKNALHLYTWSPYCPPEAAQHGFQCCPMFWGKKDEGKWWNQVDKGSKCAMGMNEVNVPSQGLLSVSEGLKLWYEYLCPLKKRGFFLVSPSVTSGADGVAWLKQFYKEVSHECKPDKLAFHYYGTSLSDFEKYANEFHAIAGTNVWVTEFACQNFGNPKNGQCSSSKVHEFMEEVIGWIHKTSWLSQYFWFGPFYDVGNVNPLNRLANKDGCPNDLGYKYLNP